MVLLEWNIPTSMLKKILNIFRPGSKGPTMITNWGPAAFSDAELSLRQKKWQEMKNPPNQAQ